MSILDKDQIKIKSIEKELKNLLRTKEKIESKFKSLENNNQLKEYSEINNKIIKLNNNLTKIKNKSNPKFLLEVSLILITFSTMLYYFAQLFKEALNTSNLLVLFVIFGILFCMYLLFIIILGIIKDLLSDIRININKTVFIWGIIITVFFLSSLIIFHFLGFEMNKDNDLVKKNIYVEDLNSSDLNNSNFSKEINLLRNNISNELAIMKRCMLNNSSNRSILEKCLS